MVSHNPNASPNFKIELLAGITTFLTTMYIVVVNPAILSQAGMAFSAVLTATVLVTAFSSIMMGLYAKNPIVVAPGMGLNAFFTYSLVLGMGVPWQTALGAVFWSGVIFLLLSLLNLRVKIVHAIPRQLRYAVAAGIGLFIALIGLTSAKLIVANPATIVGFGELNAVTVSFVAGLLLTAILVSRNVKGALILGVIATTLICVPIGRWWGDASAINFGVTTLVTWKGVFAAPDFSLFFAMDWMGALQWALLPAIFSLLFTDLFDSLSTFMGIAEAGQLLDKNGEPKNIKKALFVDAVSTTISGILGTSPGTSYIESASGIREGGRTGMTAIVAGLLFLPLMFLSPLLSVIPSVATAPVLVLVGVFMMSPVLKIHWFQLDDAIPAFLAMIMIPMTYSITQGIIWGFLSWTVIKLWVGKKEEVTGTLLVIDAFAIYALFC